MLMQTESGAFQGSRPGWQRCARHIVTQGPVPHQHLQYCRDRRYQRKGGWKQLRTALAEDASELKETPDYEKFSTSSGLVETVEEGGAEVGCAFLSLPLVSTR